MGKNLQLGSTAPFNHVSGKMKHNWGIPGRTQEFSWEGIIIFFRARHRELSNNYFVFSAFPVSVKFLTCQFSWITQHEHKSFGVPVKIYC